MQFTVRPNIVYDAFSKGPQKRRPNPLEGPKRYSTRVYLQHFINITIITFGAIFTSILLGVFVGPPTSTGGVDLGIQVLAGAGMHVFIFFVAFNTEVLDAFATRLNPYVTLVDLLLERSICWRVAAAEIAGQAFAALLAGSLFYGMIDNSTLSFLPPTGIVNTAVGWGFFIEVVSTVLMAWVIFANRKHENRTRMALAVAYVVGVTAGFVYPFIGLTTHSPFRWLANCVPSGLCGANGFWVYFTGPLVGILAGYLLHKVTE